MASNNRVTFEVATGDRLFGIDYVLSADVGCAGFAGSLRCESYAVFHDGIGDLVIPEDPERVARTLWATNRGAVVRGFEKAEIGV